MRHAARWPAIRGSRFVRRVITRPADAGGEAHEAVTEEEFAAREFMFQWQARGFRYGIPADAINGRRVAVANVSRTVVAEAARRFPVRVIEVTASPTYWRRVWHRAVARPPRMSRRGWRAASRCRTAWPSQLSSTTER